MSVNLGLRHTMQKKSHRFSTQYGEKKKKNKERRTDSGFATHYQHQTASHAFPVATTDYCLPVANTLGKPLLFQKVISTLQCEVHTCWRASSIGLSPANHVLVRLTTSTAEVFVGLSGAAEGCTSKR